MNESEPASAKRITLRDVAARVGVNVASVSTVVNGARSNTGVSAATRRRILDAAAELGYVPNLAAQRLSTGRGSDSVALLTPALPLDPSTLIVQSIACGMQDRGYDVAIYAAGTHCDVPMVTRVLRQRPRAVLLGTNGVSEPALDEVRRYASEGGVVVCYGDAAEHGLEQVVLDESAITEAAIRYLAAAGHRKIGFCQQGDRRDDDPRTAHFRTTAAAAGLEVSDGWLFDGGEYEENGARLARRFRELSDRPTALYIVDEHAASAFITDVFWAGLRVPDDISVISSGDTPAARYAFVPITTVARPVDAVAAAVVDYATERIGGRFVGKPRSTILGGQVVERHSVARVAG